MRLAVDHVADRIGEQFEGFKDELIARFALLLIGIGALMAAAGCLIVLLYEAITPALGHEGALAVIAGLLTTLGIGSFAVLYFRRNGKQHPAPVDFTAEASEFVSEETQSIVDKIGPFKLVAAAFAMGSYLGSRSGKENGGLTTLLPSLITAISYLNEAGLLDGLVHGAAGSPANSDRAGADDDKANEQPDLFT